MDRVTIQLQDRNVTIDLPVDSVSGETLHTSDEVGSAIREILDSGVEGDAVINEDGSWFWYKKPIHGVIEDRLKSILGDNYDRLAREHDESQKVNLFDFGELTEDSEAAKFLNSRDFSECFSISVVENCHD